MNEYASAPLVARLQRKGWTLERALNEPNEILPVPSPPFPPGRKYHFVADHTIALIVADDHQVITSVPGPEAWAVIEQFTPEVLENRAHKGSPTTAVMRYVTQSNSQGYILPSADLSAPWNVQTIVTPEGIYTVHLVRGGGGAVLLGDQQIRSYETAAKLDEDSGLPGMVYEAAYLIEESKEKTP